mgnify:CR=1 FL=1
MLRSAGAWSVGLDRTYTESSIQEAYRDLILNAKNYIYIENQFFVTATDGSEDIENRVGQALAQRIVKAAKNKEDFRIYVVIPASPGTGGRLENNSAKEQESKFIFFNINSF